MCNRTNLIIVALCPTPPGVEKLYPKKCEIQIQRKTKAGVSRERKTKAGVSREA